MDIKTIIETTDLEKILILEINEKVNEALGRLDHSEYTSGNTNTTLKVLEIDRNTLSKLGQHDQDIRFITNNLIEKINYILENTGSND